MVKLSVVLATYNEEENIRGCLASLSGLADEIIVVDASTDKTPAIIRQFKAKIITVSNSMMFHKNKQLALDRASGDWILQLDADERVTSELAKEIRSTISNMADQQSTLRLRSGQTINGYYLPRKNYFLGKFLKKGGQYPDYHIRLVKRGKAHFPCLSVHEQISVDGKLGYLKNDLIHLGNLSLSHYLRNANRYTTLSAKDLMKQKTSLNIWNQFKYLCWLPLKTFVRIYFRHRGFMDGFPGFVFALFSGLHYQIAYIKYWEKKKSGKEFNNEDWE
jgi:glycosyltransferase involved in cell wall biosynthesis